MGNRQLEALLECGFCRIEQILDRPFIDRLQRAADAILEAQTEEERQRRMAQGSMVRTTHMEDPVFGELIVWPRTLEVLAEMGFTQPTFTDGYIISKPAHSPALFWHYDWFAWGDPSAYEAKPPQVALMYYISDTSPANGCLRVIPGSHVTHNPLHDLLSNPHSEELSRVRDSSRPEFSIRPDEVDVPVNAGDLLVVDARLLHASHPNGTAKRRTLFTLWFQPELERLPDRVKAQMVKKTHPLPSTWPPELRARVERLHPRYDGPAEPYGRILYQRKPAG